MQARNEKEGRYNDAAVFFQKKIMYNWMTAERVLFRSFWLVPVVA
jgi:hypothetical protein